MGFSEDSLDPKRCTAKRKDGGRCRNPVTRYDASFCIFHSRLPVVVDLLQEGRIKGGSRPERLPAQKKLEVPYMGDIHSLIKFLNRQGSKRLCGKIDDSLFDASLRMAAGLIKCFEVRDVRDGLDVLETKLQNLIEKARLKSLNLGGDEETDVER